MSLISARAISLDSTFKWQDRIIFTIQLGVTVPVAIHVLQRTNTKNSKQIFPEKELRGHRPHFHIHVSVSDLYITQLPILLQEICGLILEIYKSLTDTWMWKLGLWPRLTLRRMLALYDSGLLIMFTIMRYTVLQIFRFC